MIAQNYAGRESQFVRQPSTNRQIPLARIYRTRTLPDGRDSREYLADLHALENEAKAAKHGVWGYSAAVKSRAISKSLPGPDSLRYHPDHQLIAWQPQGTLDDLMLNEIADWLVDIERPSLPFRRFRRFVDLSQLTSVALRTRHVFEFARKRAAQFTGVEPVRTALFSDDWVGHAIARLYESLMEDTLIEARAFRDLTWAAEWLGIPVDVLTLKDWPTPPES